MVFLFLCVHIVVNGKYESEIDEGGERDQEGEKEGLNVRWVLSR